MLRLLAYAGVIVIASSLLAQAQSHFHHHHHPYSPYWGHGFPPGSFRMGALGPANSLGHQAYGPGAIVIGPPIVVAQPYPIVVPPEPLRPPVPVVTFPAYVAESEDEMLQRPARPSTASAKLKSVEYQSRGDEQMRKLAWAQAYMRYRSAIDAAGDRGEARLRQAVNYSAMQRFPLAIREFKRGLFLEPRLAAEGIRLGELFGPDSQIVRTSILQKAVEWVREEPGESDRWFLLGTLLHFEDDPRSRDALQAARALADGNTDAIGAMLDAQSQRVATVNPATPLNLSDFPPLPDALDVKSPEPAGPALEKSGGTGLPYLNDKVVPLSLPAN